MESVTRQKSSDASGKAKRRWFRPRERSIRTRLILLVTATLLPVLAFAGTIVVQEALAQRRAMLQHASEAARTAARLVDLRVQAIEPVLQALATMPMTDDRDLAEFHRAAVAAAAELGQEITLRDRSGQLRLSTRFPPGSELPRTTDVPELANVSEAGAMTVTGLIEDVRSSRPFALAVLPVKRDGTVAAVLTAGILPSELTEVLRDAGAPADWLTSIVDRRGVFIARSRQADYYVGRSAPPQIVTVAESGRTQGRFENVTWEGVAQATLFSRSAVTGWVAVIGVPHTLLAAPLRRAAALLATGAAFAGLAVGLAMFFARRIASPVRALQGAAMALAHGDPLPPLRRRISELHDVWRAFENAAAIVRERSAVEAALRDGAERLRRAGDIARLAFVDLDIADRSLTASENFADVMGFEPRWRTPAEARADLLSRVHPDDAERFATALATMLGKPGVGRVDYRVLDAHGQSRWIETTWEAQPRGEPAAPKADDQNADDESAVGRVVIINQDISERRHAEEADAHLASIVGASSDAIFGVDPNGVIMSWNDGAARLYGYTAEEIVGQPLLRLAPAHLADDVHANTDRVLQKGENVYSETLRRRKDGSLVEVGISSAPIHASDGRLLGLAAVHRDISDIKRTEDALRTNSAFLELSQAAGDIGSWEWVVDTGEVRWSRQFFAVLGYDPATTAASLAAFLARVHPDDRAMIERDRAMLATTERRESTVLFRVVRPDGEIRWVERRARIVTVSPRRVVGVTIDITARRQAEEELRRTTELLTAVSATTPDLIYVKDRESRVLMMNESALSVAGMTREAVLGKSELEYHHDRAQAEEIVATDRAVIATGSPRRVEEAFTTPGGDTRVFLSTKSPLRDPEGRVVGLIGVSTDITDRKQREEQVELLMHELSHRTKNLLAVIQSLVRQLTRQSSDMSDFETRFMARIGALARAHDLLVQRHWQGTPLADVAKTQLFAFVGHESSRVIFDGPNVMLRPEAVQNLSLVMHELATNATKYGALSTPGGRIVITWTPADDALTFCWREEGGPPVTAPTRRGFGHTVITRMLAQGSEPNVSFEFPREGVRVTLRIPYDQIAQEPTVAV